MTSAGAWYWNDIVTESTRHHFDAPVHWVTGQDARISRRSGLAASRSAVVLDFSGGCGRPDFLLEVDHIRQWRRAWLAARRRLAAVRTGWDARSDNQAAFLNANATAAYTGHQHFLRAVAGEQAPSPVSGGDCRTDAGAAHSFDRRSMSFRLLGAGKYGLTQLRNLAGCLHRRGRGHRAAAHRRRFGSPCRALAW